MEELFNIYELSERFVRYCGINTMSDSSSSSFPSSEGQLVLGEMLVKELHSMGVKNAYQDEWGYVFAEIESTNEDADANNGESNSIALLAHLDTSPDLPSCEVPQLKNYDGNVVFASEGNRLLGADNKAGIAEIMTTVSVLIKNPELKHGRIQIIFTPDEEIGRGTDKLDMDKVFADYGYTVDGGEIGELEYENFNAASMVVIVRGINTHPGDAKNKMVNSIEVAKQFDNKLPSNMRPETTEGYEGFYHLCEFNGDVEQTELKYIIREHDDDKFKEMKEFSRKVAAGINDILQYECISIEIKDSYRNMREVIEKQMVIVDRAVKAMERSSVRPIIKPIRGGTDGARLSFMGLPCPNIFTGGLNFHSREEYIPLHSMSKAVETIINIVMSCES